MLDDLSLHDDDADDTEYLPIKPEITDLSKLDLRNELATQLRDAKYLYSCIGENHKIGANQKAQVLNSIGNIIKQIIDMQERLQNLDEFKAVEEALINTLKKFPTIQADFQLEYGKQLGVK